MRKIVIFMIIFLSITSLYANGDLHIYTVDNKAGKITPSMIQKAFAKNGFTIGINSDIHDGLTKGYGESGFKIYNAISLYHSTISLRLLEEQADAGIFVPMGVAIYQTENETNLHIAVVSAQAQTKILAKKTKLLGEVESSINKVIMDLLPNAKHAYSQESLNETRRLLTSYSLDVKGKDWEESKETLEENFEEQFAEAGFVMPSYFDFSDEFGKDSPYDFYTTYSICKIDVIKAVSKVRPEAAAFAPCTTMMYKKKGEDKIVMGFTAVYNWLSSAGITDKASIDALVKAQTDFESILNDVTK
ncbi:MAG: hypothetical protein ACI9TV_001033 [Sulfurimonas sp.]|jgi:uncharacterized protein (DUF302 family)|uniref:DUF302 domain-containing protein n=1 Tax=Sulfurimonas sp. TaxID=2022749 RepID=UPI0039E540B7